MVTPEVQTTKLYPQYLVSLNLDKKLIYSFNPKKLNVNKIQINLEKILPFHKILYLLNSVYVIGGGTIIKGFSNKIFEIILDNYSIHEKANIPEYKANLAATILKNNKLICAGGNNIYLLSTCHEFSSKTNQWISLPNLSEPKYGSSLCSIDNKIYCIGGCILKNGENEISTAKIERLAKKKKGWKTFPLYLNEWDGGWEFGIIELKHSEIIILGGMKILNSELLVETNIYLFNVAQSNIKLVNHLPCPLTFTQNGFSTHNGIKICSTDHIFLIYEIDKWRVFQ